MVKKVAEGLRETRGEFSREKFSLFILLINFYFNKFQKFAFYTKRGHVRAASFSFFIPIEYMNFPEYYG